MKKILLFVVFATITIVSFPQVAINTDGSAPGHSAMLDIKSDTAGILIPRMTAAQRDAINQPAKGLMVYVNTDSSFYYYDGVQWRKLIAASDIWTKTATTIYSKSSYNVGIGNSTPHATLEVSDGILVNGSYGSGDIVSISGQGSRMFFNSRKAAFRAGYVSGSNWDNTEIGVYSVAMGYDTKASNSYSLAIGRSTLASGVNSCALGRNTIASGGYSTAIGYQSEASGEESVAMGYHITAPSFAEIVVGIYNTSYTPVSSKFWSSSDRLFVVGNGSTVRHNALTIYKDGRMNINDSYFMPKVDGLSGQIIRTDGAGQLSFISADSLEDGKWTLNKDTLYSALDSTLTIKNKGLGIGTISPGARLDVAGHIWQTSTGRSVFLGENAGNNDDFSNNYNVFVGYNAGTANTTGYDNTAIGYKAMEAVTSGHWNTAIGHYAFQTGNYSNSTALGDAVAITANSQVRIGHNVSSIGGPQNWTNISDGRFKFDVSENVPGIDFIKKLRPVTYHLDVKKLDEYTGISKEYRNDSITQTAELEATQQLRTGFIAQEVEEAAQSLGFEFSGVDKPKNKNDYYGLRYAEFVVPLVKAVQEQQKMIEKQKAQIAAQKAENDKIKAQLQQLMDRIQRLENTNN